MDNITFWLWTILIFIISMFLVRAICNCRCYMTPEERLMYTTDTNKKPVELYTVKKIKINDVL